MVTKRETPSRGFVREEEAGRGMQGGSQGVAWRWEGRPRQDGREELASCGGSGGNGQERLERALQA